ncbi:MAG: TonB-dependent receptor [Hyphomonadaceae bacterium]|nr:TonB-dependent receptor [Hyphomonadaceae bacterium]
MSTPRRFLKHPLRKLLLLTSVLVAPSVAAAQQADPATQTPPEVDSTVTEAEAPPPEGADDEVVVLGRFIPEPMRQTSEVMSFLSAEDLARQGDDTAAAALTRLTGLSVVGGRFIYVRGLGDRYSSALLNGSPLPSPEPLRRTVPLDLFPSNILENVSVQKTFSPNYPGEFGGGIIDMTTLKQPSEPFLTLKGTIGANTESTGKRGLFYYGENSDWTTISDGLRDVPQPLQAALNRGVRIVNTDDPRTGFTDVELEAIGESFVNSPLTVLQSGRIDPDFEIEASAGTTYEKNGVTLGLVAVAGYDSQWRVRNAQRQLVNGNALNEDFETDITTWDVVANTLGSLSVGWGGHEIALTGLLVRSSTKQAQVDFGTDVNVDSTLVTRGRTESTAWYERQLASLQLSGAHEFGNLEIDWRGAFAQSTRDAPYEREVTYLVGADNVPRYGRSSDNQTGFSELTDEVVSGGIDGAYTLALSEQRDAVFSAGYAYANTVRNYELLRFTFRGFPRSNELDVNDARVDFLFSPDNIDPDRFEITDNTGFDDQYKGQLLVNAAYVGADVEVLPLVRAAVGVRYEEATQTVRTGNYFNAPPNAPAVRLQNEYYLPAVTLTWNFAEDLQLRLGYSQTIARPQFRELSASRYTDPETSRTYTGNPFLVDSELQNYDARLEYYFGRNQFVTVGGFYKQIEKPIEEIAGVTPEGLVTNFINAPEATLYGAELEYRTRFEMPFPVPFLADAEWLFAANYTYTFSEVDGSGTVVDPFDFQTSAASRFGLDGSQLQGTPEHIVNMQFGYETEKSQATVLFGFVDERIARRGLGSLPRVMEAPGINVDLVYKRDFTVQGANFTFGVSGRNLTNENHEEFSVSKGVGGFGRSEVNTYDRGSSFSLSLTSNF